MTAEAFIELVRKHGGFEFVIGFKDDEDHSIGGQGDKYWYLISKGRKTEYYIGTLCNGEWVDKHYVKKGRSLESKTVESGLTIAKIADIAYFCQDRIGNKKGIETVKYSHPCLHYVIGFGEKAFAVSKEYGVTVDFNDINDNSSAYHLRDISTGKSVEKPLE